MLQENKHKRAALTNVNLLEDKLTEISEHATDEGIPEAVCIGLSVIMHGLLYIGDEIRELRLAE